MSKVSDVAVELAELSAAVDGSPEGLELVRIAARLSGVLKAKLNAILVEDLNLSRLAGLPFGSTIDVTTGLKRSFDSKKYTAAQVIARSQIEAELSKLSARYAMSCVITQESSSSTSALVCRLASRSRFVLVRGSSFSTEHFVGPGARRGGETVRPGGRIVLVLGQGGAADQVIAALGGEISAELMEDILVLTGQEVGSDEMKSIRNNISRISGNRSVTVEQVRPFDPRAISQRISLERPSLTILPIDLKTGGDQSGADVLSDHRGLYLFVTVS